MQVLPSELVDAIIDHLDSDTQALAICGLVHSEWLSRSRFHLFSTIQFCPWRVKSFFDITCSNLCTFNGYIKRVEIDDSQCRTHLKSVDCQQTFFQMMTSAEFPSDLQVESIQVRNFDWTTLSLPEQQQLRLSLARFKMLRRLEFLGIAFHDLREFTRVISSFPILQHLSLHVGFSKYSDFIIASVSDFSLPQGITSVELGSEESNPVFLRLLLGPTAPLGLRRLALKNTQLQDLQLIRDVLATHSKNMEYIYIDCKANTVPNVEEFMACYEVGTLKNIRSLHLDNIKLCSKSLPLFVEGLPTLQSHLASSCHTCRM
ncbi:hypothetical protein BDQ17DRAFT_1281408 [Cyathus striatus]|nr:hypothetical protein BDQ17DRAFT_1281408 [Cyathus striatus]